jgi:D-alanyl-D-alanine carboxypeptidase
VKAARISSARWGLFLLAAVWMVLIVPMSARSAPYAAMVMDARTGEVLHSRNADTRLHPASLTKMMTLYIAFEAVERGEISLDHKVTISRNAASEPPSKLGLRAGQKIALRYLIRAAAVKSANDAATAIGEAIAGSEAAFARRMNRTAKALGMTRTTFKNAHGLTENGHLSTARDMTILGRHVLYDYPQYYNLFSRSSANTTVKTVYNTNRRLLASYKGADGIKTGYTRAAGFNLVASAQRGNERVIATVFGGTSSASRNAQVAKLLDMGFRRAPASAPVRQPDPPNYAAVSGGAGKSVRVSGLVQKSLRPKLRPATEAVAMADIKKALAEVSARPPDLPDAPDAEAATEALVDAQAEAVAADAAGNVAAGARPVGAEVAAVEPDAASVSDTDISAALEAAQIGAANSAATLAFATREPIPEGVVPSSARPTARPKTLVLAPAPKQVPTQEVVTRASTSGGRHWGVNVGQYPNRFKAESVLLRTALMEMSTLDGSLRKVVRRPQGYDANFLGLTQDTAEQACRRLKARNVNCVTIGPG